MQTSSTLNELCERAERLLANTDATYYKAQSESVIRLFIEQSLLAIQEIRGLEFRFGSTYAHQLEKELARLEGKKNMVNFNVSMTICKKDGTPITAEERVALEDGIIELVEKLGMVTAASFKPEEEDSGEAVPRAT